MSDLVICSNWLSGVVHDADVVLTEIFLFVCFCLFFGGGGVFFAFFKVAVKFGKFEKLLNFACNL